MICSNGNCLVEKDKLPLVVTDHALMERLRFHSYKCLLEWAERKQAQIDKLNILGP